MSIIWSKYFDRIYCINFIQFKTRKQLMKYQLNRVGILNSGIFQWQITYGDNSERAIQRYTYKMFSNILKIFNNVSLIMGHYNCVRDAYYNGYQHILILEDDARFLKDLDKIKQTLQHRPENGNVIIYDKMILTFVRQSQFKPVNEYFYTFDQCLSAACYELDRVGMKKIIDLVQNSPQAIDGYFFYQKQYLSDVNCFCSKTNLAIQAVFNDSHSLREYHQNNTYNFQKLYKYLEINFNDYMMRKDGSEFNYGDYIEQKKEQKKDYDSIIQISQDQKFDLNDNIIPIEMNICFIIPSQEFDLLLPILYSLRKYSQSKFNVYILTDTNQYDQFQEKLQKYKNNNFRFTFLDDTLLNSVLDKKYIVKYKSSLLYNKLLIPTLFPNLDKILLIDYDCLIKNKGIEYIYNTNIDNYYLAAVEDFIDKFSITLKLRNEERKIFSKLTKFYFNSGIILYNLKKIRQDGLDLQLKNILKVKQTSKNNKDLAELYNLRFDLILNKVDELSFEFSNQSLLNYILKNKEIKKLNIICNNMIYNPDFGSGTLLNKKEIKKQGYEDQQEVNDKTIIVHYGGFFKPWLKDIENYFDSKYQKELKKYYSDIIKEMKND